jgi:hypothetical protein
MEFSTPSGDLAPLGTRGYRTCMTTAVDDDEQQVGLRCGERTAALKCALSGA